MIRTFAVALALATAGCGGKKSEPATTSTTPGGASGAGSHEGHEGMQEGMPPEMTRFHDLLRPLWHAEQGPQRMADTCAAVPQLQAQADAIAKVTPPVHANADTWTTGTRALVAAVVDVAASCTANDSAAFEDALKRVHDSFHALMMAAGMKHDGTQHDQGDHAH